MLRAVVLKGLTWPRDLKSSSQAAHAYEQEVAEVPAAVQEPITSGLRAPLSSDLLGLPGPNLYRKPLWKLMPLVKPGWSASASMGVVAGDSGQSISVLMVLSIEFPAKVS